MGSSSFAIVVMTLLTVSMNKLQNWVKLGTKLVKKILYRLVDALLRDGERTPLPPNLLGDTPSLKIPIQHFMTMAKGLIREPGTRTDNDNKAELSSRSQL